MGDLIGVAVTGTLYYVPSDEFERIMSHDLNPVQKVQLFSDMCRVNALYMIARAGSGHIGSSFSSIDIMSWLMLTEVENQSGRPAGEANFFFSSKGHDAPALYSVLLGLGKLDFELLHQLRRGSGLPGHPDIATPNIVTNTGSLGMGISKAKGMITANRLQDRASNIYVLTGDGELQEGQIWESLVSAVNSHMSELTVVVDHNKLQSDTLVTKVSDLGDLEAKFRSFGWFVTRCDGNNLESFSGALAEVKLVSDKPKIIIADTIKGKGVSFMQHTSIDSDVELYKFHSGAPTAEAYTMAVQELIDQVNGMTERLSISGVAFQEVIRPATQQVEGQEKLIPAYSEALLKQATANPAVVALNADLVMDTGLIPFQEKFPDRFIECGIAEQDMVSQAGGMALFGLLPVVHSFACFLTARPNEQIYNNSTERKKIIYVGSLAGVLPGGPGHSHQGVRDIATMASIAGMSAVEPSCPEEVGLLLDWCINKATGPCYLRLNSLPWIIKYRRPRPEDIVMGRGQVIREGTAAAVIISHGPAMLSISLEAVDRIFEETGISIKVINLPWLNYVDVQWLEHALTGCRHLVSVEDHYMTGGQSDLLSRTIAAGFTHEVMHTNISVMGVPSGGTTPEVLSKEGLDSASIQRRLKQILDIA